MTSADETVDSALATLEERALTEPGLALERAAARREFFGGDAARNPGAERRFREWFLLERPTEKWQTPPVHALAHALVEEGLMENEVVAILANSFCGVFEVTSVVEGHGAWLRDLSSGGEHPLLDDVGALELTPRDVLIGRLYVFGATANRLSRSAALFRDEKLRVALERDLQAARARRRGVLRVSQRELEMMFWHETSPIAEAGAVERARTWLVEAGLGDEQIEGVFAELASMPVDESRWTFGMQDALAAVLERLAFETEVDLEAARRLLLAAWIELAGPTAVVVEPPAPESARDRDARAALEAFDRGRREGRDLERLFADLQRDLGIEEDEAVADDSAPDFPGVVGAVVEEFLWETEQEQGVEAARALAPIRKFADYGQGIGVFENLGLRDLMTFAAVWLPERGELADADAARATLAALRTFCAWAIERQGSEHLAAFGAKLDSLEQSLPRIVDANRFLAERRDGVGELFEVVELGTDAEVVLQNDRGVRARKALPAEVVARLVPGDRVRAVAERDGRFTALRCYPRESADVLKAK
ncbi:MAG: hypothetical protein K8S98_12465 [Planctomycetes bacterium]|nr:hypothetical protein [Planctomycetota bacterium]